MRLSWQLVCMQLGDTHISAVRSTLAQLFKRRWFRRVWIIQEAGNARIAHILCGDKSISSSIFSVMPLLTDLELNSHVQAVLDVMPGPLRKGSWWNSDRRFLTLLGKFTNSQASRDHDRIYALLGIASDTPNLPIEYGYPFQQVVCQTLALVVLGDASSSYLLDPIFPNLQMFQGITDIKTLTINIFRRACQDNQESLLKYMIDNSRPFRTIAIEAGFPGPLSFASFVYFKYEANMSLHMFSDAPAEDNYLFQATTTESEAFEQFDPGFKRLLSPIMTSDFEKIIACLQASAPERLDQILVAAFQLNRSDHVRKLLACGAGGGSEKGPRRDIICCALGNGHAETAQVLQIQNEAMRANTNCVKQLTDILWALCETGDKHDVSNFVIDGGADIHSHGHRGKPLHVAVKYGQADVVRTLLNRGANPRLRDPKICTPLHLAEVSDNCEIIALLLLAGAEELAEDSQGDTPWQLNKWNRWGRKRRTQHDIEDCLLRPMSDTARDLFRRLLEHRNMEEEAGTEKQI
ncbi:hypothetical protein PG989_012666 [Apiospora arundinis]